MKIDNVLEHPALKLLDEESAAEIRELMEMVEQEAYTEGWVAAKYQVHNKKPVEPEKTITVWEEE